jgi:predicted Zn-dependent protease with MMP-like domain
LYEGVPLTEYGADWGFLPSKITLFRNALVEDFTDPAELEHEVWITVIHELAHHLGIGEDRLHDLGVD